MIGHNRLYHISWIIVIAVLFVSGFAEKPAVPPVKMLPSPQIEKVMDDTVILPQEVLSADFPAERKIVTIEDLTISEFKGDDVFSEDRVFFVVEGKKRQLVHLEQGRNDLYLITVLPDGKRRITKKKVLLDRTLPDVSAKSPDAAVIRYMCLLKVLGPYEDEGGLFLPDNAVSAEEFSQAVNQAVQDAPHAVKFSRAGEKDVVTLERAIMSLERNFGQPVRPWPEALGMDTKLPPDAPLTRAMLARLLMNVVVVKEKAEVLKREFGV